ncbi:DNA-directed RNA polymerase subunit beta [Mycoplasmopsis gallopavonis]|uniref:DNA-directed RNA polymerase subunit beta n=4 Tax=Mycoplasmopsis gallopavonis TaxID=76629 RepID=A0A449AYV4_9BACT|nr:DNA-directed RNA polymerase subunit beta [Mycoplasmopsis gallopavonis]RIV16868.1 DNA-directed RNA polymerase subunit beta [Mycoplasmopsis gallopavonis]VEU72674.1 DNA-directed RNA polymerase subunit beta [Mycoplasmopsis gallopavonis]
MEQKKYIERQFGPKTKRRDYSVTKQSLPLFDILATSKESFEYFINKRIQECLQEVYPIEAANKQVRLDYLKNSIRLELPFKKQTSESEEIKKCKAKGTNFSVKIYATLKREITETGEVRLDEVLIGEIPYMTSGGSFIINGSEKVIVSQLIRSPGAYYGLGVRNKQSDDLFNKLEILPRIGSWLEVSHKVTSSSIDTVKVKVDKNKNINLATFLGSFGLTAKTMEELFGTSDLLLETLKKDKIMSNSELSPEEKIDMCQEELFRGLRKGDRISEDAKLSLIPGILFDKKRYNLSETGRYMLNKKLSLVDRITNTYLAEDLIAKNSDEVLFKKGTFIDIKIAKEIQEKFESGILESVKIPKIDAEFVYHKVIKQNKDLKKRIKIIKVKVYPSMKLMESGVDPILVIGNDPKSVEQHLLISDIVAAINYYFNLTAGIGQDDDPDSLTNKRIVSVGELLEGQLSVALSKLEKITRERMGAKEPDKVTAKNVTNNKLVTNQMKTFFNTSKLSQFMDQINPLAEVSNKRRVTSLGPGGLNRDTAQFEVRDVHSTHYGRICPIETPEGPNIGLILNYATFAKVNELGFLKTPYFKVNNGVVDYNDVRYLTAAEEIGYSFAQSSVRVDENNKIVVPTLTVRRDYNYIIATPYDVDFIEVSSKQIVSVAAAAIPFLENDDANRALMGSNMQRQAVPLLQAEAPLVATGIEADIAKYSSYNIVAKNAGEVVFVDGSKIHIKYPSPKEEGKFITDKYTLRNFERSNQGTLIQQRPIVHVGQKVEKGDLLVDGSSFKDGEMALGKNLLVGFSTWNGYNYEDAVIINERLVKDDVFTSIHIEEQTIQFRSSRAGDDELTNDIPNVSKYSLRHLDENGIVRVGSEVMPGDVLVGRTSPKGEENPSQEEKLLMAILQQRSSNKKDTSLKVKNGHNGTVIHVEVLSRDKGDVLEEGIDKIVKVSIAQKRKIKVGDKVAGRHGNKGVISIVLPEEDMPYLEDGTPLDVMLNPQGVPSRMNIGQILEIHLGMAARKLGVKFVTPSFDGVKKPDIEVALEEAGLDKSGKQILIDPITGRKFDKPISVGVMYMLKLNHMVDDKMHARSVGPYSLITQQPLGGKSQNGGQRFGEMETWAIESYGATNVLQEILTYKSDDISGRNALYSALVSGKELPNPGIPESFNVLSYELKGLGMKLEVQEKDINESEELDVDLYQYLDAGGESYE